MRKGILFILTVISGNLITHAQTPIFDPGMTPTCVSPCTSPVGEEVQNVLDGNVNTKWLDFVETQGFIVNTGFGSIATRIDFTTANDAPERDPVDYIIEGSNDGVSWNAITSGPITCDPTRFFTTSYTFTNSTYYSWYRVSFSAICLPGFGQIQMAEVQLYTDFFILPVKLISFTAQEKNSKGDIKWKLAQPEDGALFELQKSTDGINFTTIFSRLSDNITREYAFTDQTLVSSGIQYYRLKITDQVNKTTYSNIAIIKTGVKEISVSIYPNPIRKGDNIQVSTTNATLESVKLVNSLGQILLRQENIRVNGSTTLQLPQNLQTGIYYLILNTDKGVKNEKVVIQ